MSFDKCVQSYDTTAVRCGLFLSPASSPRPLRSVLELLARGRGGQVCMALIPFQFSVVILENEFLILRKSSFHHFLPYGLFFLCLSSK